MNPKDIMTDAIHNFHPQYQQYTQYSSGKPTIIYFPINFISKFHKACIIFIEKLFQVNLHVSPTTRYNFNEPVGTFFLLCLSHLFMYINGEQHIFLLPILFYFLETYQELNL